MSMDDKTQCTAYDEEEQPVSTFFPCFILYQAISTIIIIVSPIHEDEVEHHNIRRRSYGFADRYNCIFKQLYSTITSINSLTIQLVLR